MYSLSFFHLWSTGFDLVDWIFVLQISDAEWVSLGKHRFEWIIYFISIVNLRSQKRLAASVASVGQRKIWLDPAEQAEIGNANSRTHVKKLIKDALLSNPLLSTHALAPGTFWLQSERVVILAQVKERVPPKLECRQRLCGWGDRECWGGYCGSTERLAKSTNICMYRVLTTFRSYRLNILWYKVTTSSTKNPRVMSSRTSVYWWSTFTRPRLRSHARRCSQTKWRPVVSKTKFVTPNIIHLPCVYDLSSVGCPWTSCCPCRWETTGYPCRWARGVQGVDIGLYLSRVNFSRYMITHVAFTRHFQKLQSGRNSKYVYYIYSSAAFLRVSVWG